MTPITSQPYAITAPVVAVCDAGNEKGCSHPQEQQHYGHPGRCQCKRAHASRSRRILAAVLLAALSMVLFALVSCLWDAAFNEGSWLGLAEDGTGSAWSPLGGFVKRQSDGTSGNGGNTFVDRKYYLIVVFVGLVLVILAAICLSAWCCRGAFENPLCCPCYLCACCGGLACLECIGCGLCAEGISDM
ncbi:hypothetical protein C8T65DRAFT_627987 [Cerioporus squamosus]|nr:hypothetical protein C8T65DRAFT_627987 [Cerioporus squamosus]